jgi:hypothetical protein
MVRLLAIFTALGLGACTAADIGDPLDVNEEAPGQAPDGGPDTPLDDSDGDGVVNVVDNCPGTINPEQEDADGDDAGDACDCDSGDSSVKGDFYYQANMARAMDDFAAPSGFAQQSWADAAAGLVQTRLVNDGSDALFLDVPQPDGDFIILARAASTEIANFDTLDLRQVMLLVGATDDGGNLTATACGIEVVEGLTPTQRTSVLELDGPAGSVQTTALERQARTAVVENEQFDLRLEVIGDTVRCTTTLGSGERTVAEGALAGGLGGSIGLYTRESKALFTDLRICGG